MNIAQLQVIFDRLVAAYGEPLLAPDHDPLGGLVATILSQSTSDINSQRAFGDLRAAFASWDVVRDAPVAAVVAAIRRGGLANLKAARIQTALRALAAVLPPAQDHADLDARFSRWLLALPVAEARASLQRLPGVGPKTAACVLLFSLGLPSMPVDTHVYRVSQRLGLLPPRTSLKRAHEEFDHMTPEALVYPLHILLITHGRKTCHARNPRCAHCPLLDLCPYGQRQIYGAAEADPAPNPSPF